MSSDYRNEQSILYQTLRFTENLNDLAKNLPRSNYNPLRTIPFENIYGSPSKLYFKVVQTKKSKPGEDKNGEKYARLLDVAYNQSGPDQAKTMNGNLLTKNAVRNLVNMDLSRYKKGVNLFEDRMKELPIVSQAKQRGKSVGQKTGGNSEETQKTPQYIDVQNLLLPEVSNQSINAKKKVSIFSNDHQISQSPSKFQDNQDILDASLVPNGLLNGPSEMQIIKTLPSETQNEMKPVKKSASRRSRSNVKEVPDKRKNMKAPEANFSPVKSRPKVDLSFVDRISDHLCENPLIIEYANAITKNKRNQVPDFSSIPNNGYQALSKL